MKMGSFINHVDMAWQGERVCQMSILLHKLYLVKLSTKEKRGKNAKNTVHNFTWLMNGTLRIRLELD